MTSCGDAFVAATHSATVGSANPKGTPSAGLTGTLGAAPADEGVSGRPAAAGAELPTGPRLVRGPAPSLVENPGNPFGRALGHLALSSNTSGTYNTAIGFHALRFNTTGSRNTASGGYALYFNSTGTHNTASGDYTLVGNTAGSYNTATGQSALTQNSTGARNTATGWESLTNNTTGSDNTAIGIQAFYSNITGGNNAATGSHALGAATGSFNTANGVNAGLNATTGSYNVFLGADVSGTAADTNTIRIGLPYDGFGGGQNKTFIAGIHGTQVTGRYLQVVVDVNGQLGTLTPPVQLPPSTTGTAVSVLQHQVHEQQATVDDLRSQLARMEALLRTIANRR